MAAKRYSFSFGGTLVGHEQMWILLGLDWRWSKAVCSQGEGKEHQLKPLSPTGPDKETEGRREELRSLRFSTDVALQPPGLSSARHDVSPCVENAKSSLCRTHAVFSSLLHTHGQT